MEKRGAGLKLPVALSIKDMPPMVTFNIDKPDTTESLIGNPEKIEVVINQGKNVNLKNLTL